MTRSKSSYSLDVISLLSSNSVLLLIKQTKSEPYKFDARDYINDAAIESTLRDARYD